MKSIKVLISDFQFLTRSGLENLINEREEFELVGVLDRPDNMLEKILKVQPDVLVLDYDSRDPIMQSTLKRVISSQATHLLIISNEDRKEYIRSLLDMRVKGIVTKGCSRQEIINAIEAVSRNRRFFCNRVLDRLMENGQEESGVDCEPTHLSPREYEVLKLITRGKKTAEIAEKLSVSVHTINSHRKNILKKLNLKSPTELVVYALESGLVKA